MINNPGGPSGPGGPNRIFDEFAKLMTDAAGVAQGMRKEAETVFRSQAERMLNGLDLVKRDEFDAVREMAANARQENDRLIERMTGLEARLAKLEGGALKVKKPSAKSTTKTPGKTVSKKPTMSASRATAKPQASKKAAS